jgi:hypothetical protein
VTRPDRELDCRTDCLPIATAADRANHQPVVPFCSAER